jgi:hypothetical protein
VGLLAMGFFSSDQRGDEAGPISTEALSAIAAKLPKGLQINVPPGAGQPIKKAPAAAQPNLAEAGAPWVPFCCLSAACIGPAACFRH